MNSPYICQFSSSYPPVRDGVGDFVAKLHRLFLENNINSLVLTSKVVPRKKYIINYLKTYSLLEVYRSIKILKGKDVNTIIFHYPTTFYGRKIIISIIPILFRFFGFKVVLYLHEYYSYSVLGKIRILPMIFSSNYIITSDSLHKKSIQKIYKGKNILEISGGINFQESHIGKLNIDHRGSDKIKIVYFGFIKSGKGLEKLAEVIQQSEQNLDDFSLSIIGSLPENYTKNDETLKNKIESNNEIRYLGFMDWDQLLQELVKNDYMILPFEDGLTEKRGSFMTAMSLGIPVITTIPRISIEGLAENENILFIKNLTKDEIINKLQNLIKKSDQQRLQLGKNAKKWYFDFHSEKIIFNKITEILDSL